MLKTNSTNGFFAKYRLCFLLSTTDQEIVITIYYGSTIYVYDIHTSFYDINSNIYWNVPIIYENTILHGNIWKG